MKKILIGIGAFIVIAIIIIVILYNVMFIGKNEAKSIALDHLNIKETDAKKLEVEFDYDAGSYEYKVDFIYDNLEYEYTIDAKSGDIILHQTDR